VAAELPSEVWAQISPQKSACSKVSRVRHMVPGGSRESLPKRKVRFADQPEPGTLWSPLRNLSTGNSQVQLRSDNKQSAAKPAWPPQLEMRVPFEPTAFPSGPYIYVMYELHLTNFGTSPVSLSRIEVLDSDAGAAQPIATFECSNSKPCCSLWEARHFLTPAEGS
jgi:hypothetical protein